MINSQLPESSYFHSPHSQRHRLTPEPTHFASRQPTHRSRTPSPQRLLEIMGANMEVVMPVSIVGGFLCAGGLLSCSAQLRDHPEGLRSDLKGLLGGQNQPVPRLGRGCSLRHDTLFRMPPMAALPWRHTSLPSSSQICLQRRIHLLRHDLRQTDPESATSSRERWAQLGGRPQ